jgi:DHA2 family multidrug resistance protein-like MFS transporter
MCIAGGLVVGWIFLARQRRAEDPMIDLAMFGNRAFGGSLLANTIATFALVGNAVFITQYLQLTLGMSPLRAALWSLVPTVAVAGAAPLATTLGRRYPRGRVMAAGFLVGAVGYLVLGRLHPGSPLVVAIVGSGVLATGLVMILTLVTDLVVGTVTPERAGAASALMETCSEFGGALGIAVLGSIGAAVYGGRLAAHLPAGLSAADAHSAGQGLAGAVATSARLHGQLADALLATARHAFTDEMNVVALVGAAILVAAAGATVRLVRNAG